MTGDSRCKMSLAMWFPVQQAPSITNFHQPGMICVYWQLTPLQSSVFILFFLFFSCVRFSPLTHISTGLSLVALLDVEE